MRWTVGPGRTSGLAAAVTAAGRRPRLRVRSFHRREAGPDARRLEVDPDTEVIEVVRIGRIDGRPALHAASVIPSHLAPDLSTCLDDGALPTTRGRASDGIEIRRTEPPAGIAAGLGVSGDCPCWLVLRSHRDMASGVPVILSRIWMRPDLLHPGLAREGPTET